MQSIPLKKQNKKAQQEFYSQQRGSWGGVNPVTRIKQSDKAYDRNRVKRETHRSYI